MSHVASQLPKRAWGSSAPASRVAEYARADHKVRAALNDRLHQKRHFIGVVTVITVQEYDDIGFLERVDAREAGPAVSPSMFVNNPGAHPPGQFDRPVRGALSTTTTSALR